MHTATKLQSGMYMYRGFRIEDVSDDIPGKRWDIYPAGKYDACDAAESLKEAKQMIDRWHNHAIVTTMLAGSR